MRGDVIDMEDYLSSFDRLVPITRAVAARCAVAMSALVIGGGVAVSTPAGWREMPYEYAVVEQSLVDILTNFGHNTGLRMSIAPAVHGNVVGRIDARTAGSFLDVLTQSNGLDWYYDRSVMYISAAADQQTAMVPLRGMSFDQVKSLLAKSGFIDERYAFSAGPSPGVAIASGPPSYVAVIKQAVETMAAGTDSVIIYHGSQPQIVKFP
jgi:type II secretory pathway component GspD/PulD (secretin)